MKTNIKIFVDAALYSQILYQFFLGWLWSVLEAWLLPRASNGVSGRLRVWAAGTTSGGSLGQYATSYVAAPAFVPVAQRPTYGAWEALVGVAVIMQVYLAVGLADLLVMLQGNGGWAGNSYGGQGSNGGGFGYGRSSTASSGWWKQ
ncbi:hypothetical protein EVAR_72243_1 [Eumeta japonica]|uniref:Uncharacterized protein n=1 Tax=Eumeta variegata TaxID=151549 RepID=A0A4C1TTQ4_EUMVA|nr:hypothetical protein EVAR_72243_1 [Eumeta japonica]